MRVIGSKTGGAFGIVCALACFALAGPSYADAYEAALSRALVAKEKALDTNDPSDWSEALRLFLDADALQHTKVTTYETGVAAARLRVDDLAVEAYEASLSLGLEGSAHDKAQAFVDENVPKMARLNVTGPEHADVAIDGWRRGTLPLTHAIVVFPGTVHLHVTSGGKSVDEDVKTKQGETATLDLGPAFAPAVVAPTASASSSASTAPVEVAPKSDASSGRTVGWAFFAGGLGLAAISATTVVLASSSISSHRDALAGECLVLNGPDSCKTTYLDLQSSAQGDVDAIARGKTLRTVGWIGLGVGAASAVYGLVRLLGASGGDDHASTGARPTFVVGASGVALGVQGAF